jgi:hypothetical protein
MSSCLSIQSEQGLRLKPRAHKHEVGMLSMEGLADREPGISSGEPQCQCPTSR